VIENVAIVVIGRNEGDRLRRCLESVGRQPAPALYVDSGSTDGSVELAHSMGFDVVELDASSPFTAARARNAGLERILQRKPELAFVQFVDGDCEMVGEWLERGIRVLSARPDAAVVFGRIRERFRNASIYNRLCDIEWDIPIGEVGGSGGVAMMRVGALRQVNGFDPTIIAGEDTELCARLRSQGWKILHVDAEMARHDAAMMHAGQWWKRAVRAGHGFAEFSRLQGCATTRFFVQSARSTWFWGCLLPLLTLVLAWPSRGLAFVLLGGYPLLICRIYRRTRRKGASPYDATIYALHCTLGKFPQTIGMLMYHFDRARNKQSTIIEHKEAARTTTAARL